MTQSFDEWWEENYMNVSADRTEAEDIYNLGAQPRQEEVSELQAEVDCLKVELKGANERALMLLNHKNNMVDKMQARVDELQKRIEYLEEVNESITDELVCYRSRYGKGESNE